MKVFTVSEMVAYAKANRASDIHITMGLVPHVRVDGKLREIQGCAPVDMKRCDEVAHELAGKHYDIMDKQGEGDYASTISGSRCRINLFRQQGAWSLALRILNDVIPDMESLGLPRAAHKLPKYAQGLALVTGETGSGKSTTLAAILGVINRTQDKHILTLEDPIEYVHTPDRCVISQREIGKDTQSFAMGLRAALREDPDVILVGEMRDLETIETALTAAETGHLVFGTVHTNSAAESIDRLVDVFPEGRQQQIRLQLSMSLMCVISQQLLPHSSGSGRVLACEVMQVDGAIRNLIREGKTPQIISCIQTTGAIGNILMEKSLQQLLDQHAIDKRTYEDALPWNAMANQKQNTTAAPQGMLQAGARPRR